ncbi:amidase [Hyphomicrobium sp. 99]|uniref:amidase n=1 Tax=Hyphomicrobium sp. 99 TaxID=1163419 RepID=UPI0005F8077D|nr:amidase [Hyphomicrobium sp. 99]
MQEGELDIAAEQTSGREHIERCLARIETFEPELRAFVVRDAEVALTEAAEVNARADASPLAGLALGVKDIIDATPYPTGCGSPIHAGTMPVRDAAAVAQLRAAGAVVMGKTVTTEFAFFSPGPTRNPYDGARTPGGSSSGSAAAVAVGLIDAGLGSQTAASITRPASFCGVVGFKPSYGTYSLAGVKGLAPSFDTLGALSRDVATMAAVHSVLANPIPALPVTDPATPRRVGVCRTQWWNKAEQATRDAIAGAAAAFATETEVEDVDMASFEDAADLHASIMAFEAAQTLACELASEPDRLSPVLRGMLETGTRIGRAEHVRNLRRAEELRARVRDLTERYDVLLAPAAVGEAPLGLGATGDPIFSRAWTLLRLPAITLPGFVGPAGLPVGVQLISGLHDDERLLAHALWAERLLPRLAPPSHY